MAALDPSGSQDFRALRSAARPLSLVAPGRQHLGHRERGITDRSYTGTDYRLNREIEAGILEQSVSAWEHMLSTPQLGGRAGAEILAKRPRFRGARMKRRTPSSYARMLVESGLTLGVCDWGFCVYRQEHSACLGSATAPNPLRREPSTCASCRNFVVSKQHRTYWLERAATRLCQRTGPADADVEDRARTPQRSAGDGALDRRRAGDHTPCQPLTC